MMAPRIFCTCESEDASCADAISTKADRNVTKKIKKIELLSLKFKIKRF